MAVSWHGSSCISVKLVWPPAVRYLISTGNMEMSGLFTGPESIVQHVDENAGSLSPKQLQDIVICVRDLFPGFL
jgi:hypothetical protein